MVYLLSFGAAASVLVIAFIFEAVKHRFPQPRISLQTYRLRAKHFVALSILPIYVFCRINIAGALPRGSFWPVNEGYDVWVPLDNLSNELSAWLMLVASWLIAKYARTTAHAAVFVAGTILISLSFYAGLGYYANEVADLYGNRALVYTALPSTICTLLVLSLYFQVKKSN